MGERVIGLASLHSNNGVIKLLPTDSRRIADRLTADCRRIDVGLPTDCRRTDGGLSTDGLCKQIRLVYKALDRP